MKRRQLKSLVEREPDAKTLQEFERLQKELQSLEKQSERLVLSLKTPADLQKNAAKIRKLSAEIAEKRVAFNNLLRSV